MNTPEDSNATAPESSSVKDAVGLTLLISAFFCITVGILCWKFGKEDGFDQWQNSLRGPPITATNWRVYSNTWIYTLEHPFHIIDRAVEELKANGCSNITCEAMRGGAKYGCGTGATNIVMPAP